MESFTRSDGESVIGVLAPQDLPAEAATWAPEKVTMYWLSGQAQSWRVRIGTGEWIEIDLATAQKLHDAADDDLAQLICELAD